MAERLRRALDLALDTVRWASTFEFPDIELDHDLLAVHDPGRYPIEDGGIASTSGLSFTASDFPGHVTEAHVPHSTALHATLDGHRYLTGPLTRYSLNSGYLSPAARQAAADARLGAQCRNPFRSVLVRALEIVYAVEEALRIIDGYQRPDRPAVEVAPHAGTGHGVSDAPRGAALPPLRARRRRPDPVGHDHPPDVAEPGRHQRRPPPRHLGQPRPRRRVTDGPVRADNPQP
jgi:sulfhydrogenase subunit alpha